MFLLAASAVAQDFQVGARAKGMGGSYTAFEDDPGTAQTRRLYRLWLAMPNSRALPPGHAVLWGSVEAGTLRGGIGQVAAP